MSNEPTICTIAATSTATTIITDMFDYDFMINAFTAAGIAAVVSGIVGYFLVMRGQTFAGHALSHIGFAGAAMGPYRIHFGGRSHHGRPERADQQPRRGDRRRSCAGAGIWPAVPALPHIVCN